MANIDLPDDEVRGLERVAPRYLRGEKRLTLRVRWAISEAIKAGSNGRAREDFEDQPSGEKKD